MAVIFSSTSRLCDARVEAYRTEFGSILADRIIESEAADFLWEARVAERYLGQHVVEESDQEPGDEEVSRVLVLSCLAGSWSVGLCLVDGEGAAVALAWKLDFDAQAAAEEAFCRAH